MYLMSRSPKPRLDLASSTPSQADWLKLRSLTRPTSVTNPTLIGAAERVVTANSSITLLNHRTDNQEIRGLGMRTPQGWRVEFH